jgi:phenylalanyl-tRNA synthetase beta chain
MRVPLSWLKEYIDLPDDAQKLAHDLTMSGTNIEAVETSAVEFEGVYVGKVIDRQQHPNADRLSVCKVTVADEELSIVCGAPNVRAGLTVAVAKVGARLPGDFKIRKSKIRGEVSFGMICSARELGLGQEHDGILELDEGLESGKDFHEVIPAGETFFEAEITPNRPDCLALFGIAREVAALYGSDLRLPAVWDGTATQDAVVPVTLENAEDCSRYIGRVIRNVTVAESPDWLKQRLLSMGSEPINNIVDITNFVLFETGQPLHAFDLDKVRGAEIIVRRARNGETLKTLDGGDHKLDPDILVIADAEGPMAIAGVMGGLRSMVQQETRSLLLEAAWFRPKLVRSGRRKLGLDTDASYRFERRADVEAARWAADRATQLFVEIAGAEVVEQAADAYPLKYEAPTLAVRATRVNQLIGTSLDAASIATLLQRLQLAATVVGDDVSVRIPSFRRDLKAEIDLVEEVARMHGYENIPDDALPSVPLQPQVNPLDETMRRVRNAVVSRGYYEVRPSVFMDQRDPDRLQLKSDDARRQTVTIRNPLVSAFDTMRTTLLPGVLQVMKYNRNRGQESVRLLQLDRVFLNEPGPLAGLPTESERLLVAACGNVRPPTWGETARRYDFYDLKGELEGLLDELDVDSVWTWGYTQPFLEEATSFVVSGSYGDIGFGGEIREDVRRAFDIDVPVFIFDLNVAVLGKMSRGRSLFEELPRFPAVKRDLSLVVPQSVNYRDVVGVVKQAGGANLETAECFDVFHEEDKASSRCIGLRLRFRSPDRTLTDDMVDPQIHKILRKLQGSLQVALRAG